MRKSLILYLILTFLIITGCGLAAVDISKLGPEQLVNTYYQSLAGGDYKTAKACLDVELAAESEKDASSDFNTIKTITSINVSSGVNQKPYNNYQEVKIVVEYNAEYKDEFRNGLQTRNVIVARKTSESPWRITSIGAAF